ncbi:MAG: amidohydrolase family protein [Burkholderiales bacterium]|nr:amidohydrolase family protein [Burkholderiales bacterium]
MLDLAIRGATVYDGSGGPSRRAEVGVRGGRIVAVGALEEAARATVDAGGLALMPGIVDVHTHYDAQVTWDATLSPSPSLGVTTAVIGNCGFGIAPCPPAHRELLLRNLSVVEGMDLDALLAGTQWDFETFGEYMASLRRLRPFANVAVLAQHSTIRTAVMGEAACERAASTPDELGRMRDVVRGALRAGAIGFASSFSPNHSGWGARPMPSTLATDEELAALVGVLGEEARGVFVSATGPRATPEYMENLAAATGRPAFIVTVLTMYNDAEPDRALGMYERCRAAIRRGREVYIHASCQPLSFDFTLRDPYVLYSHGAFARVKQAARADLSAVYRDPAFRAAFRADLARPQAGILFAGDWRRIEIGLAATDAARSLEGRTIAELAHASKRDPVDVLLDTALEDGLDTVFVGKFFNSDDDGVEPLLQHPAGVVALSDAGAHLKFLCDAGFGLHFLGHWVRERRAFSLEEGVRRLTSDPARKYRIPHRGRIVPGAWADLLLFDPATVGVSKLERASDLPGGGTRMIRRPRGVHGVWVNGMRVFDGERYDAEPGPGHVLDRFAR